ncbi:uncharacterized protein LOC144357781, partial [Saccoglossus kowalevskii]
QANYELSFTIMRSPVAINLLQKFIKQTSIYRNPLSYVDCIDTHYVETFNIVALLYHDKRINFQLRDSYKFRSDLTCLDWNENVDRPATSVTVGQNARAPRRRSGKRNLTSKT